MQAALPQSKQWCANKYAKTPVKTKQNCKNFSYIMIIPNKPQNFSPMYLLSFTVMDLA